MTQQASRGTIHLVCNSHIDPVWLWEWEEGAAEALSTFRAAADLCEEFEGFIFNHNEAILYEWVERYEPALFERIQRLVREGRWHIMGGWYVQPDCNMPSGESFVRQILLGKRYFRDRFSVDVTTAINFDPFGHTRGLVQILKRSGFDSYIFCRPSVKESAVPAPEFTWLGYDGSEIFATLAVLHYNSAPGEARAKLEQWLDARPEKGVSLLLWGVGNHGGGPSRQDLRDLAAAIGGTQEFEIRHSTPEEYVADFRAKEPDPPLHAGDLNPWAVGCYTSMSLVKQRHRRLENELFTTEKMAATAAVQGLLPYPADGLRSGARDLASCQFHDSLPGSSIQAVEGTVLRTLDHGLETLARIKARAFFALASGQRAARDGDFPLLIMNPHPFRVETLIECELQPQWPHKTSGFLRPVLFQGRKEIPVQAEKERCNIDEDHRKRVAFRATLEPGRMNRFDCKLVMQRQRPARLLRERHGRIRFHSGELHVEINCRTGLVDRLSVLGVDLLAKSAFSPLVMMDDPDPWGMRVDSFRRRAGAFRLLGRKAGARFSGIPAVDLPSVRVIEDGPVRGVVEAVFGFGDSCLCQQYKLPREGTEFEVETRVYWNEKDRMLKLSVPTRFKDARLLGQVAYGVADLPRGGKEGVAQQWVGLVSEEAGLALTCINDGTHGADMARGELRLSLLRSPAYAGHPTSPDCGIVQKDRFTPRMDQGERCFRFWFNAGPAGDRLQRIDREALARNAPPMALCFFPPGAGKKPVAGAVLSDPVVQLAALKQGEDGDGLIIRLFEPTGKPRSTTLSLPFARARTRVRLKAFEIRTLRFDLKTGRFSETDLLERPIESMLSPDL
ncbi:MAG: glycoside hydrolase family 38 C-terminal domain-containing protein [Planctomycetota bacterium]